LQPQAKPDPLTAFQALRESVRALPKGGPTVFPLALGELALLFAVNNDGKSGVAPA